MNSGFQALIDAKKIKRPFNINNTEILAKILLLDLLNRYNGTKAMFIIKDE